MLDRTRSHKFVNAFASSSSVFVFVGVVICVFLLLGEFLLFVWVVEEDKNLSKNASISLLKKKIRAKKKFDYF